MKPLYRAKPLFVCFILLGFWLLLSTPLAARQYEEEVSSQEYLFTKGMLHTVSAKDRSIKVQQKKGPVITIFINSQTEFEGVDKYEELQVRQVLKVWYRPEQSGNTALRIIKLPDLGC